MKFSIIVPVYNVEKYLRECLDSVLLQSYTDFELILVDDGSDDSSGRICDEYACNDKRIKVFHQFNSGVSSARNIGLNNALGEWTVFLDSDDMLSDVFLQRCVEIMSDDIDIIQCELTENPSYLGLVKQTSQLKNVSEAINNCDYNVCIGGTIIRSRIYRENNIRFNELLQLGEDQVFVFDVLVYSKKIYSLKEMLYFYRRNEGSATMNPLAKSMLKTCELILQYKQDHIQFARPIDKLVVAFVYGLSISNTVPILELKQIYDRITYKFSLRNSVGIKIFSILAIINFKIAVSAIRLYYKFRNV